MGEIFLACNMEDKKAEKLLVLKVLRQELAADQNFVDILTDEANIIRNLDHPNIVSFHDFGYHKGTYFIVLEYIHGGPLEDILAIHNRQSQKVDLAVSMYVIGQLCSALGYAHEVCGQDGTSLNLVHRDVTPANLLVSSEGDVKLADFGLVRAKGRVTHTMPGILKGRLGYMAPELMKYEEIDARADIFGAGVLFYEMLAGQGPITNLSLSDMVSVMEDKSYPKPSELNQHVPPQLDKIILKALEPLPNDRWQSILEVKDAVEELMRTWSKNWAKVYSGQERLSKLMLLLYKHLSEPPVSPTGLDSLMRQATAQEMLEEGVIEAGINRDWLEETEHEATLVRSSSSPALFAALNEMIAAPQLLTKPLASIVPSDVGFGGPDEQRVSAESEGEMFDAEEADPEGNPLSQSAGQLMMASKIDVRASQMNIVLSPHILDSGKIADTVESIPTADESLLIQEEVLRQELHLATLRKSLSIRESPKIDGWEVESDGFFCPGRSGDIRFNIDRPQDAQGMAFLQVVDEEPPLGLFTVRAAATLRACMAQSATPASGIAWSNRLLLRPSSRRESVSACYVQFDESKAQLHYVNAGYPPPFFYKAADKNLFSLAGSNQGLGAADGAEFDLHKVPVATGDIVLIVTTGLLEAKNENKEVYGWQRAQELLLDSVSESAAAIVKSVSDSVRAHIKPVEPTRDWTVIVLKRT